MGDNWKASTTKEDGRSTNHKRVIPKTVRTMEVGIGWDVVPIVAHMMAIVGFGRKEYGRQQSMTDQTNRSNPNQ
jgi:hypothetical protein